jgi:hypothetical protein
MARKLTPAKVYANLERAEKRLALAFTKWTKARAAAKRLDAKLDREGLPGELDVREFGIKARPWPKGARS